VSSTGKVYNSLPTKRSILRVLVKGIDTRDDFLSVIHQREAEAVELTLELDADPSRKILMFYYVYCLDAWLKSAPI